VTYIIVLNTVAKSGKWNAPQLVEDFLQTMLEHYYIKKKAKQRIAWMTLLLWILNLTKSLSPAFLMLGITVG